MPACGSGKARYYLWAWLLPVVLFAAAGLLTVLFGQARFDPAMTELIASIKAQSPGIEIPPPETLSAHDVRSRA